MKVFSFLAYKQNNTSEPDFVDFMTPCSPIKDTAFFNNNIFSGYCYFCVEVGGLIT